METSTHRPDPSLKTGMGLESLIVFKYSINIYINIYYIVKKITKRRVKNIKFIISFNLGH